MTRLSVRLRNLSLVLLAVPVVALAQQAYTNRSVAVRAGPDTQYPVVATVGTGAPVEVFGCLDDWSWCDVGYSDLRGWVYGPYLNYVYYGSRVPLYTYAPSLGIPIVSFSVGPYWDRYYYGRPWYGRRDYWIQRTPVHVRPQGPPPRYDPPPHVRPNGPQYQQYQQHQQSQNNQPYRGGQPYNGGGQQYNSQRGSNPQAQQNQNRGSNPQAQQNQNRGSNPQGQQNQNRPPAAQPQAQPAPQQGAMPQRQAAPTPPASQAPPARQTLQQGPPPSGAAEGGVMGK